MTGLLVVVSVDWEGRSLLPQNLQRMAEFRSRHPDVPLQHFLNAAYYTRTGVDPGRTTEIIQGVLRPDDEHGLHLHAWQGLLTAAGVKGERAQSLLQTNTRVPRAPDDWGFYPPEEGYDAPIEHLSVGDLVKVIATSNRILTEQGFNTPRSFRAGGWLSGSNVRTALAKNGFALDCSAVSADWVMRRFGVNPLGDWLTSLWPNIQEASQPYRVSTPEGVLWEVPNNACLVDYVSADETVAIFERAGARWEAARDQVQFVSTGFHQETARVFLDRVEESVARFKEVSARHGWPLLFSARPADFLEVD